MPTKIFQNYLLSPSPFTGMLAPEEIRQDTRNMALVDHNFL